MSVALRVSYLSSEKGRGGNERSVRIFFSTDRLMCEFYTVSAHVLFELRIKDGKVSQKGS